MLLPQKNPAIRDITYLVDGQTVSRSKGGSFSFGYTPSGGVSKTIVVYLGVSGVTKIKNIRLFLKSTGDINFEDAVFGVDSLDYIDTSYVPTQVINGTNPNGNPNSEFNFSVENGNNLKSKYVYLNISFPRYKSLTESNVAYGWIFEYDLNTSNNEQVIITDGVVDSEQQMDPFNDADEEKDDPPQTWVAQSLDLVEGTTFDFDPSPSAILPQISEYGNGQAVGNWRWVYNSARNGGGSQILNLDAVSTTTTKLTISVANYPTIRYNAVFNKDENTPNNVKGSYTLLSYSELIGGISGYHYDPNNSPYFGVFPSKVYIRQSTSNPLSLEITTS